MTWLYYIVILYRVFSYSLLICGWLVEFVEFSDSLSSWCVDDSSHLYGVISYSSQVFLKYQPYSPLQSISDGFEESTNRSRPIDNVLAQHSLSTTHMGNQCQMILRFLRNIIRMKWLQAWFSFEMTIRLIFEEYQRVVWNDSIRRGIYIPRTQWVTKFHELIESSTNQRAVWNDSIRIRRGIYISRT